MLVPPAETVYGGFNPKYLFAEGLAFLTPLLWLCFAINLMGLNFLIAWMPTLLIGQKLLAQSDAASDLVGADRRHDRRARALPADGAAWLLAGRAAVRWRGGRSSRSSATRRRPRPGC
jgi:hypothetical protein